MYAATLDWLFHLEVSRGWDLKLESVRAALARLGSPERRFDALHVAGTNGKGSTSAIAHAVLGAAGVRAGLYTSPHLVDFRERIRIGDESISEDAVVALVAEIRAAVEAAAIELTFFELATVLALLWFARAGATAAVVEVGLGGRLDATNVLVPRAAVVTTIALDHERYLGETLASIAREKAGIFKPGVPAVVGRVDDEVAAVLEAVAAERGSPLIRLGRDFHAERGASGFCYRGARTIDGLVCGLRGGFQIDNAACALAGLERGGWLAALADDVVRRGVAAARWPGRLEVMAEHPLVVLDGAHNPAGAAALAAELPALAGERPIHLVFGVLADKRWAEMVDRLAAIAVDVVVVPVAERRSEDPSRVAEAFAARAPTRVASDARAAVDALVDDPRLSDHAVVVAGSLFLVGEIRRHLLARRAAAAAR